MKAVYEISWHGYRGNPQPENHFIEHFSEDNGFTPEEIMRINNLEPGAAHTMGGPFDSVTVERLQDKKRKKREWQVTAYNENDEGVEINIQFDTDEDKWQVWINGGILAGGNEAVGFEEFADALIFANKEAEIVEAN